MPFDFKKYDAKCATLDGDALQREWEHYTRLISGAATSTAVSGIAVPFTLGVSTIGVGLAAPAIHNARKKREIIERHLQRLGRTHHTRKRDVITAGAISGTVGVVTLGLAPVGADAICNSAAEHGIAYIAENELAVKVATHLALDAAAVAAEETHMHSRKEQEAWKAYAQAVKQGKNPSLPNSDLKIPLTTNTEQATSFHPSHQAAPSQIAPLIHVVPPSQQETSAPVALAYFPPPPGQADLGIRRHSISSLSFNTQPPSNEASQLQPEGHLIFGTATAISAPVIGGQSYGIQVPRQSSELPSRPSSAIGYGASPIEPVEFTSATSCVPQQPLSYPPPPAHVLQPGGISAQQYQTQLQRPRAYSTVSFDRPPNSEMYRQSQHIDGTTHPPLPPPSQSAPMPPTSPSYSLTSPVLDYARAAVSDNNPMLPQQFQQQQSTISSYQSAWPAPYNPGDYAEPQRMADQQQQYFHAPAQLVYTPQDMTHPPNEQKTPLIHQYEIKSPTMTMPQPDASVPALANTPSPHTLPDRRTNHSYFSGKPGVQQIPYFPPPPTAY